MTPTVQEVVEQVVDQIEGLRHTLHNCDEGGCGYVVQARELIADALMTFARARERAVWEEAAQVLKDHYWDTCGGHGTFLLQEFRRHATGADV